MDFEDGEWAGGRARGARGPAPGVCLPPQDGRVCGFVLWAARAGDGGPGPDASRPGAARGPAADLAWGASPPPPLPTGRPRCELRGLRAPSSGAPWAARNLPALRGGAARARGGSERVAGGAEPRHGRAASGSCDASQGETSIKRSIGVGSDLPPSRNPRVVTK